MASTSDVVTGATGVAIAASTVPADFLVPGLVDDFRAAHPEFEASVAVTDTAGVFDALRRGTAEVGFAGDEPDGDDLVATAVATDEIVLAVPATHRLAGGSVPVSALDGEALVVREEGSGTRRSFVDALARRGTPLVGDRTWTVRDRNDALLDAVAEGHGVGIVSAWALERRSGADVVAARLDGEPLRRDLYLVLRDDAVLGPAASTLVDQVRGGVGS